MHGRTRKKMPPCHTSSRPVETVVVSDRALKCSTTTVIVVEDTSERMVDCDI